MVEAVELKADEIETLRAALTGTPVDHDAIVRAYDILDRLSPPEPEQLDEATKIWREMMALSSNTSCVAENYRKGKYDQVDPAEQQIHFLSELIASKDAEIEQIVKRESETVDQLEKVCKERDEWKLASEEARSHWDSAVHEWNKTESELAALRAENERLKGVLAKIAAFERGGVILTGTSESDRDYMIGIARQACPRELWYGKAAERNTAEPADDIAPVVEVTAWANKQADLVDRAHSIITEAEARGRREALEEAHASIKETTRFDNPIGTPYEQGVTDQVVRSLGKIERMMAGGK